MDKCVVCGSAMEIYEYWNGGIFIQKPFCKNCGWADSEDED